MYVPSALRGQKRVLDLLELESVMVVSHPVGTGKQTRILWKNKRCESPSHLSRPSTPCPSPLLILFGLGFVVIV